MDNHEEEKESLIAQTRAEGANLTDELDGIPLRCKATGGYIDIRIGMRTLCFAAEQHPDFWDGESGPSVPNIKITDVQTFAIEVARAINAEAEDGSTLLTRTLDAAIAKAVESGCDGVEHDD